MFFASHSAALCAAFVIAALWRRLDGSIPRRVHVCSMVSRNMANTLSWCSVRAAMSANDKQPDKGIVMYFCMSLVEC